MKVLPPMTSQACQFRLHGVDVSWQHSAHGEATWELCDTSTKSPGDPAAFSWDPLVVQKLEVPRSVTSRQCCLATSADKSFRACVLLWTFSMGQRQASMNCQVTVRLLCLKAQLRATWHRTDTSNTAWEGNEIAFAVSHGRATYHGGNPDTTCLVKNS